MRSTHLLSWWSARWAAGEERSDWWTWRWPDRKIPVRCGPTSWCRRRPWSQNSDRRGDGPTTGRRIGIAASREHRKDVDADAPNHTVQRLVVGRAGPLRVLRDRVKPLAFDIVPVTTDVGAKVIGGGARHVSRGTPIYVYQIIAVDDAASSACWNRNIQT